MHGQFPFHLLHLLLLTFGSSFMRRLSRRNTQIPAFETSWGSIDMLESLYADFFTLLGKINGGSWKNPMPEPMSVIKLCCFSGEITNLGNKLRISMRGDRFMT